MSGRCSIVALYVSRGEDLDSLKHALIGAGGGAIIAALLSRHRSNERGIGLAVILGVAAGIYVGYGLQDGRPVQVVLQIGGALPFIIVAARWSGDIGLLGLAWLSHSLWDGAHDLGVLDTGIPSWYPAVCLGFDVVLGMTALYWRLAASRTGD